MNAILRLISQIVAFGDPASGQSQKLRFVDWTRDTFDLPVKNPKVESMILAPDEERVILGGQRSIEIGEDTRLSIKLVDGTGDRYRLEWSDGQQPVFRTKRDLALSGCKIDILYNSNGVVSVEAKDGGSFEGVEAGDTVWIPSAADIGSSPFNPANTGFWTVLAATNATLELIDYSGAHGLTESNISITSNAQFQAFSSEGVQAGDSLQIFSGFAKASRRNYSIVDATPTYIEFTSTAPIPQESDVLMPVDGMVVYTSAKNYLRLEANQECVVRINGDTSSNVCIYPWIAGEPSKVGIFEKTGPVWSLVVVNRSPAPLSLTLISAE